jgi:two-component system sensor histidine kinase/response regulator
MNHHILIVEDSPTQAEQLRHLLEEHDYEVAVAADGKEGLAAARTHKPALIIADILMPVMDGYELCHALKEDEALTGIPIILLTSLSSLDNVIRGLNSGADFYVTKPCNDDFLLRRVEVALAAPVQQKRTEAEELEITYLGKRYIITSDRRQILKFLLSMYEGAVQQNQELIQVQLELQRLNEQLETRVEERTAVLGAEIIERKRAEEALKEYSERLEEMVEERAKELRDAQEQLIRKEKLAVLGQLAGGVGHELRNPLAAIKSAAYFLDMVLEEPAPEVKETLEILQKEVATSERTISSLLDFARAKSPIWRKVDIKEVVQEALSRIAVPENVEVVSRLDGRLPTILADPDQLSKVFGNIILNAVQAMPEGGQLVVKTLKVSEKLPKSEWVAISFTDTGVGIPEESLGKLFEPLFTTKAKGIGLGMAVTKTLVEGHGGSIEVQSELGKGSTFTVRLPTDRKEKK